MKHLSKFGKHISQYTCNVHLNQGYGALPMYFDVMGTNFVIAVRQSMGNEWYEALEWNWLQLFNMLSYTMRFGWNLQRAEEQKQASSMSKKRTLGFSRDSWKKTDDYVNHSVGKYRSYQPCVEVLAFFGVITGC